MNTETYERLLSQLAKLSAENQAQSEALESDWLKGFYAGQANAYESAGSVIRILNDDYTGTVLEGMENAKNV